MNIGIKLKELLKYGSSRYFSMKILTTWKLDVFRKEIWVKKIKLKNGISIFNFKEFIFPFVE